MIYNAGRLWHLTVSSIMLGLKLPSGVGEETRAPWLFMQFERTRWTGFPSDLRINFSSRIAKNLLQRKGTSESKSCQGNRSYRTWLMCRRVGSRHSADPQSTFRGRWLER